VLNNAVSTYFLQQNDCSHFGALEAAGAGLARDWNSAERPSDLCLDEKAWRDGAYAVLLHREALRVGPRQLRCPSKPPTLEHGRCSARHSPPHSASQRPPFPRRQARRAGLPLLDQRGRLARARAAKDGR